MIKQVTIEIGNRTYQLRRSVAVPGWVELTKKHGSALGNYPATPQGGMAVAAFFAGQTESQEELDKVPSAEKFEEALRLVS